MRVSFGEERYTNYTNGPNYTDTLVDMLIIMHSRG